MLLAFAGRFPLAEFHRQAGETFDGSSSGSRTRSSATSRRSRSPRDGVDWERAGLRGPSATWTYLVGENPFGASGLVSPLGRTGMAAASVGVPWLVLLHGASVLWQRRRQRAGAARAG